MSMMQFDDHSQRSLALHLVCLLALSLCSSQSVPAQEVVLKDHLSVPSVYNTGAGFVHFDAGNIGGAAYASGVAAFTGNGGILTTVSGIYYKQTTTSTPNGGNWLQVNLFEFKYWPSQTALTSSPYVGTVDHYFLSPSNPNWLTSIGTTIAYGITWDLYRFDFDVAFLNIQVDGTQHFTTVVPNGLTAISGQSSMMFSNGGPGSIGTEIDWYVSAIQGWPMSPFPSLNAPFNYGAFRVAASEPPPVFTISRTSLVTVLSVSQAPNLGSLNVGSVSLTIVPFGDVLATVLSMGPPLVTFGFPGPNTVQVNLNADLTPFGLITLGGCNTSSQCSFVSQ